MKRRYLEQPSSCYLYLFIYIYIYLFIYLSIICYLKTGNEELWN